MPSQLERTQRDPPLPDWSDFSIRMECTVCQNVVVATLCTVHIRGPPQKFLNFSAGRRQAFTKTVNNIGAGTMDQ